MTEAKQENADHRAGSGTNAEKDVEPNRNETTTNGCTKLGELGARVGEELSKIGSGGPWVWCVFF